MNQILLLVTLMGTVSASRSLHQVSRAEELRITLGKSDTSFYKT